MGNFVKYNDNIVPKPYGFDYDLIPGKVYTLIENSYTDEIFLKEDKEFEFPNNYYLSEQDNKFVDKVLNTFNNTDSLNTGVLLSGLKGSGKTLMVKHIAKKSGLPIIVIDQSVDSRSIEPFFAKMKDTVCVIFDEIDKNFCSRMLLGFLDGVKPSCKKLTLCTANDEDKIDEYLNDRCSRIRYKKTFKILNKNVVKNVLKDMLEDEKLASSAADFIINSISIISFDNVITFGEDIKNNPDESFDEILSDLNIAKA